MLSKIAVGLLVAVLIVTPVIAQDAYQGQQWEYLWVYVVFDQNIDALRPKIDGLVVNDEYIESLDTPLYAALRSFGEQGYELIHIDGNYFVFKRPKAK